jgi:hypothetical protein
VGYIEPGELQKLFVGANLCVRPSYVFALLKLMALKWNFGTRNEKRQRGKNLSTIRRGASKKAFPNGIWERETRKRETRKRERKKSPLALSLGAFFGSDSSNLRSETLGNPDVTFSLFQTEFRNEE